MKNTGVVRKIDELGRIVIPKEIRKTLNIGTGEDLQIFVENDSIVLKKYIKMLSLKEKSCQLIKEISKFTKSLIYVSDKENIIVSSNNVDKNTKLSKNILSFISERKEFTDYGCIFDDENNKYVYYYGLPIIIDADAVGSVIVVNNVKISEKDILLISILRNLIILNVY